VKRQLLALTLSAAILTSSPALAWHDATHMAVMAAAGLGDFAYLAAGADMAKQKSGGHEEGNHYCDNHRGAVITADMVLDQVRDYNCRCFGGKGHLYGAIIAALDQYYAERQQDKYARYSLGYAAHYIGDLSMPLHNIDYDDFNKANHAANDAAAEKGLPEATNARVAAIAEKIRQKMHLVPVYRITPAKKDLQQFNSDVARKVAEIASKAIAVGFAMHDAKPPQPVMTKDEAYGQLAQSAVLLKAVYTALQ
jgi:hypothetical protein